MRHDVPGSLAAAFPMSVAARDAILFEAAALGADSAQAERLEMLRRILDLGVVLADPARAAIGRRVAILDGSGGSDAFFLVLPGDGDPSRGWISIDSPLGVAVAGRRAGERVEVAAPAGAWGAEILSIEEPPYPRGDAQ